MSDNPLVWAFIFLTAYAVMFLGRKKGKRMWYVVIERSEGLRSLAPYILGPYPTRVAAMEELERENGLVFDCLTSPRYISEECYVTPTPPEGIPIDPSGELTLATAKENK